MLDAELTMGDIYAKFQECNTLDDLPKFYRWFVDLCEEQILTEPKNNLKYTITRSEAIARTHANIRFMLGELGTTNNLKIKGLVDNARHFFWFIYV